MDLRIVDISSNGNALEAARALRDVVTYYKLAI